MTISDAIPVQFWVNGVETFNEKEVCGINSVCFCQPFNCTDEIRIQVYDSDSTALQLSIFDSSNIEIAELSFTEVSNDIFELTFIPNSLGICNEQIRLGIFNASADLVVYEYFTSSLGVYSNFGASGNDWDWGSGGTWSNAAYVILNTTDNSKYLRTPLNILQDDIISISLTGGVADDFGGSGILYVTLFNGSTPTNTALFVDVISEESFSLSGTINATANYTHIGVWFDNTDSLSTQELHINEILISIDRDALATSDCLDIKTSHECTQLVRYTNSKDFADIEYTTFSPNAEFYIRIPAVFFHERNTEEQERFETSGQTIVRLRDEIKIKRLLEIGFMPDYMHRKLLLILAHDTVEIDNEEWVRNDPYEKVDGNRRYPLKKANVLLTQQGYIKRNIL